MATCEINIKNGKNVLPILDKWLEENPITEEGLNKARYRLAYEDGYRQCIKDAAEWLKNNLPPTMYFYMFNDEFVDNFKEEMEDKL